MRMKLAALVCCFLASYGVSRADEAQPPKPGPEQELLKQMAGEWDATVAFMGKEQKGSAVYKLGFGGFWLTEDFKGEFGGHQFEGRGTTGYDPIKKKYVSTWIDSASPSMMVMEGNFDKDGTTYTETGEGPAGIEGKSQKLKSVFEFKDKDTFVFTMYEVADGKPTEMMKITYKRKK
jgi:Protein of unknown function (DUF1579)